MFDWNSIGCSFVLGLKDMFVMKLFSLILGHQALIWRVPCLFKDWPLILLQWGEEASLIMFKIVTEARRQSCTFSVMPPSLHPHFLSFNQISLPSFIHISTCFYELFDIVCVFKLGFIVLILVITTKIIVVALDVVLDARIAKLLPNENNNNKKKKNTVETLMHCMFGPWHLSIADL